MSRAQAFDGQFWEGGSYEELPTEYAPARPRRHKSARRRGRPEWVVPPAAPEVLDYEEARPVRMGRGRQGGGEAAPRRLVGMRIMEAVVGIFGVDIMMLERGVMGTMATAKLGMQTTATMLDI
ncbi:hypothetical protein CDD81_1277 [Ophiocordyceps australis]|uniref:Uncharacterized protein n=1 Tax=Ophiocordyceps australis TaxID=1399860 RepID=A0A2C5X856_9HYPO|nr:hypothetical protein CDD81_1277 [Ophiocordyceps australis]